MNYADQLRDIATRANRLDAQQLVAIAEWAEGLVKTLKAEYRPQLTPYDSRGRCIE